MNNLHGIIAEIIPVHFQELERIPISSTYRHLPEAYLEFTRHDCRNYHIDVDNSLRRASKQVLIGGIAHELAHISAEVRMGNVLSLFDWMLYACSSRYQAWDERRTDLQVVEHGLGRELLDFMEFADAHREKYDYRDGLTTEELKQMLQKSSVTP